MNDRSKRIAGRALEEALALQVVNLFTVLNQSDPDDIDEAYERYERGLKKAVTHFEELYDDLGLEG